jgi:glycerol dehydrogenase-like iron-containing ADH family enzyme
VPALKLPDAIGFLLIGSLTLIALLAYSSAGGASAGSVETSHDDSAASPMAVPGLPDAWGTRVRQSESLLQGPGALDRLGELLAPFGSVPIVVTDAPVLALLGGRIRTVLAGAGLEPHVLTLDGEITHDAVDALAGACAGLDASLVVGIGGGKSLDAAKSVALRLELPVVTVPTIASNDSPTSSAIAMYERPCLIASTTPSIRCWSHDTALIAAAPADSPGGIRG